jgi:hypothetical protein
LESAAKELCDLVSTHSKAHDDDKGAAYALLAGAAPELHISGELLAHDVVIQRERAARL